MDWKSCSFDILSLSGKHLTKYLAFQCKKKLHCLALLGNVWGWGTSRVLLLNKSGFILLFKNHFSTPNKDLINFFHPRDLSMASLGNGVFHTCGKNYIIACPDSMCMYVQTEVFLLHILPHKCHFWQISYHKVPKFWV